MKLYSKPYPTDYGPVLGIIFEFKDIISDKMRCFNVNKKGFTQKKLVYLYRNVFKGFTNRYKNGINGWQFKTNKFIINNTATQICKTFFDLMIKDLIYNNYEFKFPDDTCRLSIGYKTWTDGVNITKFRYNMKTGGLTPIPRIVFETSVFQNKLKYLRFYIRLASPYYKMLMDEVINNNHEYLNTEHYANSEQ